MGEASSRKRGPSYPCGRSLTTDGFGVEDDGGTPGSSRRTISSTPRPVAGDSAASRCSWTTATVRLTYDWCVTSATVRMWRSGRTA